MGKHYIYPQFHGINILNAVNFADKDYNNLGQISGSGAAYGICNGKTNLYKTQVINGISTLTLTSECDENIRYVRITNQIKNHSDGTQTIITSGSQMIVTVNEPIE